METPRYVIVYRSYNLLQTVFSPPCTNASPKYCASSKVLDDCSSLISYIWIIFWNLSEQIISSLPVFTHNNRILIVCILRKY